jgi:hypothetical protein
MDIQKTAQWLSNHPINRRTIVNNQSKVGRNSLCPCGSGKKYKNCCLLQVRALKASGSVSTITKKDIIKSGKYLKKKFDKIREEIEKDKVKDVKPEVIVEVDKVEQDDKERVEDVVPKYLEHNLEQLEQTLISFRSELKKLDEKKGTQDETS